MKWDPAIVLHEKKFEAKTGINVKNIVVPDDSVGIKETSMLSAKSGAGVALHLSPSSNIDFFRADWIQSIDQIRWRPIVSVNLILSGPASY